MTWVKDIDRRWASDLMASSRGDGIPELDEAATIAKEHVAWCQAEGRSADGVVRELCFTPPVPTCGWDDAIEAAAIRWCRRETGG